MISREFAEKVFKEITKDSEDATLTFSEDFDRLAESYTWPTLFFIADFYPGGCSMEAGVTDDHNGFAAIVKHEHTCRFFKLSYVMVEGLFLPILHYAD